MDIMEKEREVAGVGEPSAIRENSNGGLGIKALKISPAEYAAGEEHLMQVSGHDAPTASEKKIERVTAIGGGMREKG